ARRREEKAFPGTINREIGILRRGYTLARRAGLIVSAPYIAALEERNARTGTISEEEFQRILAKLSPRACGPIAFAHATGWRMRSEILKLTWSQVDFVAERVRLEPNTTKNKEPRVFPFTHEVRGILEQAWRGRVADSPYVFPNHDGGKLP